MQRSQKASKSENGNQTHYKIFPEVSKLNEFIEISQDFANPLDLLREAISNSYDAGAKRITIDCSVITEHGTDVLKVSLKDDGSGMNEPALKSFFDLGNSTRKKGDPEKIGEKGHGTKVFFNSSRIHVKSTYRGYTRAAIMEEPRQALHNHPDHPFVVNVTGRKTKGVNSGTEITILGYNGNDTRTFNHDWMKDYILWFTKHGSIESLFERECGPSKTKNVKLWLRGLGFNGKNHELIPFGHVFPKESDGDIEQLKAKHGWRSDQYFCSRLVKEGSLVHNSEIKYQMVFSLEGTLVKTNSNPMIRYQGKRPKPGDYRVQDRYGLWLCKDFIPIERQNNWIVGDGRGSEYTRLHAFINCQGLNLTANRASAQNTRSDILEELREIVEKEYQTLTMSDDWEEWENLSRFRDSEKSKEKEENDLSKRSKLAKRANIADFNGLILVEPRQEHGVYALVLRLGVVCPDVLPFRIVDYDTWTGIDAIVKDDSDTPVSDSDMFYVEFKRNLVPKFNHSFKNTRSIVCWDTDVKDSESVIDIADESRKLKIFAPTKRRKHTRHVLSKRSRSQGHDIEVFVLKDYLKEKLGIQFRPRTASDPL